LPVEQGMHEPPVRWAVRGRIMTPHAVHGCYSAIFGAA
jgi:hypothetical protein